MLYRWHVQHVELGSNVHEICCKMEMNTLLRIRKINVTGSPLIGEEVAIRMQEQGGIIVLTSSDRVELGSFGGTRRQYNLKNR